MKYGETLRQRSIPAWSHHNIDYDDIKQLIKEHTTPGQGKTVSIPGTGDQKLAEVENALFEIFRDQHSRIDLFVKSKSGEIRRRLVHAKKQLKQLSTRNTVSSEQRTAIGRLERYGRLENDVLKAGNEIRCLSRFTSAQRTAFRKLLKKYKKWADSAALEIRLREEVLDDPRSFTKIDLGPLLDDYSHTLRQVRKLYEATQQINPGKSAPRLAGNDGSSVIERLLDATSGGSKVQFDTAIATVPLGEAGALASYFVHPEDVVELQVLLLQHFQYYTSRSRSNSMNVAPNTLRRSDSHPDQQTLDADHFSLIADNLEKFAHEQSAVTIEEREQLFGSPPQKAKVYARWTSDEDAILSVRSSPTETKFIPLRKKQLEVFFDKKMPLSQKAGIPPRDDHQDLLALRDEVLRDPMLKPLCNISSCRSRFIGVNNGPERTLFATLDTEISMERWKKNGQPRDANDFPFALLQVRREGKVTGELLTLLDHSHLVERVRGFSLQYHAMWQTCRPTDISPPFWMPILSRDIRKLPPPASKRGSLPGGSSSPRSGTRNSASSNTAQGVTDSTTAVETRPSSSNFPKETAKPLPHSARKMRQVAHRADHEHSFQAPQKRYWSEYDHPDSDGKADNEDAYVLYIDPNAKSSFDVFLDTLCYPFARLFSSRKRSAEESPLLSPAHPANDDASSTSNEDEEARPGDPGPRRQHTNLYGTLAAPKTTPWPSTKPAPPSLLSLVPATTLLTFPASLSLLLLAYILASTSKHKFHAEVNTGVLFAVVCSAAFAALGFGALVRHVCGGECGAGLGVSGQGKKRRSAVLVVGVSLLVAVVVGCGGLVAWVLG